MAVLSTFENRNFDLADLPIVFKPQTDLVILNYIANYIIQNGKVNQDFVNKHVNFRLGNTDIGYGLRPTDLREKNAQNSSPRKSQVGSKAYSLEEYAKFVSEYTLEKDLEAAGRIHPRQAWLPCRAAEQDVQRRQAQRLLGHV